MNTSGFDNFKKTLEDYLQNFNFLYSGDVINSVDKTFFKKIKHLNFSTIFIKEIMVEMYGHSFKNMVDNSEEVVIHRDNFVDVYDIINGLSFKPSILFFSNNSNKNLNLGHSNLGTNNKNEILPDYFSRKFQLMSHSVQVSAYYSPSISDTVDDCHFYLIDKPIQSMVWSLQNMTYDIKRGFSSNDHTVKIPFYNCDYRSLRVRVINTQKLREEKINSILYDN